MPRYDLRSEKNSENDGKMVSDQLDMFDNLEDPEYIPTMKDMFKLVRETHRTVSFLANQFDDMNKKIKIIEQQNKTITNENEQMQQRISYLEINYYRQQQQQLNTHLTIHGIPKQQNENLENIVINTVKVLNNNITTKEIKSVRRMNNNNSRTNNSPILVVEFMTNPIKQEIQQQFKENGPIMLNQIFTTTKNETTKIYINEYLTDYTRNLLTEAKKLKTKYNFKYVWVKNGLIYAREKDGSDIIKILHHNSIRQITERIDNTSKQ